MKKLVRLGKRPKADATRTAGAARQVRAATREYRAPTARTGLTARQPRPGGREIQLSLSGQRQGPAPSASWGCSEAWVNLVRLG
jgi:hypothetical protein